MTVAEKRKERQQRQRYNRQHERLLSTTTNYELSVRGEIRARASKRPNSRPDIFFALDSIPIQWPPAFGHISPLRACFTPRIFPQLGSACHTLSEPLGPPFRPLQLIPQFKFLVNSPRNPSSCARIPNIPSHLFSSRLHFPALPGNDRFHTTRPPQPLSRQYSFFIP